MDLRYRKALSTGWGQKRGQATFLLDIFWLTDESLEDSDNLPAPDVLAQEIVVPRLASLGTTPSQGPRPGRGPRRGVDYLEAVLEEFREIATDLGGEKSSKRLRKESESG